LTPSFRRASCSGVDSTGVRTGFFKSSAQILKHRKKKIAGNHKESFLIASSPHE
jgi:hypothetical protein